MPSNDDATFEKEVGDLLALVGYRVYGERLLGYKKVDLYAEYDILGRTQRIAVECKQHSKPLSREQLLHIVVNYRPLYDSGIIDQLLLVTANGVSPTAAVFINDQRVVHHQTLHELRRTTQTVGARAESSPPTAPLWGRAVGTLEHNYCFVLMPFSDVADLQAVYVDHVKPTLETACGLRCERADDIHDVSGVMQSIWESINRAALVVAELTGKNPNVFTSSE